MEEYLVDLNGKAAAIRAGYAAKSAKSVEVQAVRLLGNASVKAAIEVEMQARRERLRIDADRITEEYAKIAFGNIRDYIPRPGEELDLHRLNNDQTAAIENINLEETYDVDTRDIHRRIQIKMHNKIGALDALARHLGLLSDRHEGRIERSVKAMTPAERVARVEQLRAKARAVYLPPYEQALADGEPGPHPTGVTCRVHACPEAIPAPANDNAVHAARAVTQAAAKQG